MEKETNFGKRVELDVKDRKILSELDMDARQPLSALAKKVGLSREVVNYRIGQLEKKGVVQGYYTVLDTSKLGLIYCRMLFKYRKMPAQKESELLAFCAGHKNIAWVVFGEGKWDLVLVVLAESLKQIESVYAELSNGFGSYFQDPYTSIAFSVHEFKHKYLEPKQDCREVIVGGGETPAKLDKTDLAILSLLSNDARLSLVELAGKLKTMPKVISYRIKNMLDAGVILAFRARINTKLLGYDHYKVFLTLQSFDSKNRPGILSFLQYHPNVVYITKPMGTHTLEFEAMVRNANELHEIMRQFKDKFGNLLIDYDIYFTYEVRSLSYLPKMAPELISHEISDS